MQKNVTVCLKYCLVAFLVCFSGCCGCGTVGSYCVNVNNISLTAYDNSDSLAVPAADQPVPVSAFYLGFSMGNDKKTCGNSGFLLNSAYATTCPKDRYRYHDSAISFHISCNRDYANGYPAGAELTQLFHVPDIKEVRAAEEELVIYPKGTPDDTGTFIFIAKVILADGKILESVAQPIKLTR